MTRVCRRLSPQPTNSLQSSSRFLELMYIVVDATRSRPQVNRVYALVGNPDDEARYPSPGPNFLVARSHPDTAKVRQYAHVISVDCVSRIYRWPEVSFPGTGMCLAAGSGNPGGRHHAGSPETNGINCKSLRPTAHLEFESTASRTLSARFRWGRIL
jgi:hypothetical protein